jgi:hypothetical protein
MTVPFLAIGAFAVAVGFFVEHCIAADDRKATRSEKSREMHQKKQREKRNKKTRRNDYRHHHHYHHRSCFDGCVTGKSGRSYIMDQWHEKKLTIQRKGPGHL